MSKGPNATEAGQLSLTRLERVSDIVHAVALLALLLIIRFLPSELADEEVGQLLWDQVS